MQMLTEPGAERAHDPHRYNILWGGATAVVHFLMGVLWGRYILMPGTAF